MNNQDQEILEGIHDAVITIAQRAEPGHHIKYEEVAAVSGLSPYETMKSLVPGMLFEKLRIRLKYESVHHACGALVTGPEWTYSDIVHALFERPNECLGCGQNILPIGVETIVRGFEVGKEPGENVRHMLSKMVEIHTEPQAGGPALYSIVHLACGSRLCPPIESPEFGQKLANDSLICEACGIDLSLTRLFYGDLWHLHPVEAVGNG